VSVLSGEATASEQRSVERWRRASAENERVFQEFLHAWRIAGLHESQERIPAPPPAEQIIEAAHRRRQYATPLESAPSRRRHVWHWAVAAAAALIVAGLGSLRIFSTPVSLTTTGPDEVRTITLADGSIIRLGSHSELRVPENEPRTVHLTGVAFFAVATDSSRPFIVETSVGQAQALGTRFEIRAGRDSLRLVVLEGRVGLTAEGQSVEASAGELSRITEGVLSQPEPVDVWSLLDWPRGILIFQATPLEQALEEVAARFETRVVIRDTALAHRSVTAWFETEPVEEIVSTICQVVGARCTVGALIEVTR